VNVFDHSSDLGSEAYQLESQCSIAALIPDQ